MAALAYYLKHPRSTTAWWLTVGYMDTTEPYQRISFAPFHCSFSASLVQGMPFIGHETCSAPYLPHQTDHLRLFRKLNVAAESKFWSRGLSGLPVEWPRASTYHVSPFSTPVFSPPT
ncbi:hypothetical protein ACJQWK_08343 [Exserohilum turcicum]